MTEKTASRQIAQAAGTVMVALILSNLTGLIRQILVTNAFGTQADFDAFNAANRVSETLFYLVAGGALSSAFIPTFTSLLTKGKKNEAWKLASAVGNWLVIILTILSILAAVFATQIVRYILAPGFSSEPALERLTVDLLRMMLVSAIVFGISGLIMGILNSHQRFFIPALAPSMYQIGLILGIVFLVPFIGIFGLAWGVVIGAFLHLLLQVPLLIRLKGEYYLILGIRMDSVREVARLMVPRLLGVAVVQLNFWVNTRLASRFVEGSVTGVVLAFALMLMPQAAIAQSIAIAAMPTFSAQVALGKIYEMRIALANSLRGALTLSIPATFGLILLRTQIISLLYQRGAFDDNSTRLVSWALLWFAVGLVGHSIVEILSRTFYALHDTKTPVMVGIVAMSINVGFSYLFSAIFLIIGWLPHGGLALANSLATGIEAIGLILFMRHRLGQLMGRYVFRGTIKALIASMVMSFVLWLWLIITKDFNLLLVTIGGVILGGIVFIVVGYILHIHEIRLGFNYVKERFPSFR